MKASENEFPLVRLTPAAAPLAVDGVTIIYAKPDGLLYSKDSTGAETPMAGGATAEQGALAETAVQPAALTTAINTRATNAQGVKADSAVQPAALTAALAGVATSAQGAKADTAVQPASLSSAIAGTATSAQGAKADSAVQPAALASAIAGVATAAQGAKADTALQPVAGKGLSTEDYTSDDKAKVAGVATGATANSSDAVLLARPNQTGIQQVQTIQSIVSGMRHASLGGSIMNSRKPVVPFLGLTAAPGVVSGTPKGAWGMVKMVKDYAGPCCQVRRPSDNAVADIQFLPDGIVDSAAIRSFRGDQQYIFISKLYDQTPNAYHAVQATAANQPYLDTEHLRNGMPSVVTGDARFLTIDSGMVIASNKNCAVWTALGNCNSRVSGATWQLGASAGLTLNLSPGSAFSVQFDAGTSATKLSFASLMQTLPNANGCVVGVNSSAAAMSWIRNADLFTRATLTGTEVAANMAGGTIGVSGGKLVDIYGMVVFDASMTAEDIVLMKYTMGNAYAAVIRPRASVVICGDSIVQGTTELGHTYSKSLMALLGSNVSVFNVGLGGQQMSAMATDVPNRCAPLFRTGMPNVGILCGGTNDVTGGRTLAQMQADAITWCTAMKAAGFITVMQTLLPRPLGATGAGTVTQVMFDLRIAFNDWVRANCGPGKALADFCIDVQNVPTMATTLNTTDVPDGQHPVNSGYVQIASGAQAPVIYQAIPALVQF